MGISEGEPPRSFIVSLLVVGQVWRGNSDRFVVVAVSQVV